jgi:hypothetical protein
MKNSFVITIFYENEEPPPFLLILFFRSVVSLHSPAATSRQPQKQKHFIKIFTVSSVSIFYSVTRMTPVMGWVEIHSGRSDVRDVTIEYFCRIWI